MIKRFFYLMALVVGLMSQASIASAAFTIPVGSVADLGPVEAWLGVAVVAYLALFGYRKFTKSANRT